MNICENCIQSSLSFDAFNIPRHFSAGSGGFITETKKQIGFKYHTFGFAHFQIIREKITMRIRECDEPQIKNIMKIEKANSL